MRFWWITAVIVWVGGIAMTSQLYAGPSMSSAWLSITIGQDVCIKAGSDAVKDENFDTRFEVLGNSSIYGELDDYTALVRCAADKGMVYFVVAGPTGSVCSNHMNAIRDNFSRKAGTAGR